MAMLTDVALSDTCLNSVGYLAIRLMLFAGLFLLLETRCSDLPCLCWAR